MMLTMDGSDWDLLVVQIALEVVGAAFRLDENESFRVLLALVHEMLVQQFEKHPHSVVLLRVDHGLGDEIVGGADAADGQEDVVLQEIASEPLHLFLGVWGENRKDGGGAVEVGRGSGGGREDVDVDLRQRQDGGGLMVSETHRNPKRKTSNNE